MIDVKEAIEILDNPEEFFECEIQLKSGYWEASDMAIEALKKLIPLKTIETWDDGFVCPICNGFATCQKWKNGYPYNAEFEYCPTCGQKLEHGVE